MDIKNYSFKHSYLELVAYSQESSISFNEKHSKLLRYVKTFVVFDHIVAFDLFD